MAKKKHNSKRDSEWTEAKRLCRLSQEDVRKAKELGLNPRKLIKNRPNASERWKQPVHLWIRELYARRLEEQTPARHAQPRTSEKTELPILPEQSAKADASGVPYEGS